ncbi:MAG: DNA-processing protein DprA [Tenericutes bacterium]|nr:MAG: DNA-processing protein DprA [Mycoplasmatota bacterium]
MNSDNVLQAILLLCSFFNKNESRNIKPLTPTEYSRLAAWLHQHKYTPADFITREDELLIEWQDPKNKITKERLAQLLQRAASMGFALEKWQQQNVWVLSRASQDYPRALRILGDTRSPLLYGIGNKSLLNTPGIGFVGSRDTNTDDEMFTTSLAQHAVKQGFTVVSGGAKGIDQTSMQAALEAGGCAIGVLADSLLKAATKPLYRQALQKGRLLLITPFYPEASFNVGNAMGRNKYIYALSKGVFVAKSDEKGGTWSGATENLKKQRVPLWVRDIEKSGNQKLIEQGGDAITTPVVDFNALQKAFSFSAISAQKGTGSKKTKPVTEKIQPDFFTDDLFAKPAQEDTQEIVSTKAVMTAEKKPAEKSDAELTKKESCADESSVAEDGLETIISSRPQLSRGVFLDLFYQQLQQDKEQTYIPKELAETYPELSEAMIKQWLKTLEEQGSVKRQGRKLAYNLIKNK